MQEQSKVKRIVLFLLPAIFCCGLPLFGALSCYRTTPMYVESRVRSAAATVPPPEGAILLIETLRNTSGSDCVGMTYYWVYGSNAPLEEILAGYREALANAGWKEVEVDKTKFPPGIAERILGRFRKGEYPLDIDRVGVELAIIETGAYEQKEILRARAAEFETLFMVSLSFSTCSGKW